MHTGSAVLAAPDRILRARRHVLQARVMEERSLQPMAVVEPPATRRRAQPPYSATSASQRRRALIRVPASRSPPAKIFTAHSRLASTASRTVFSRASGAAPAPRGTCPAASTPSRPSRWWRTNAVSRCRESKATGQPRHHTRARAYQHAWLAAAAAHAPFQLVPSRSYISLIDECGGSGSSGSSGSS